MSGAMTKSKKSDAKARPKKAVPEDWLQVTRHTAAEPISWHRKAFGLREAAGLLWDAGNEGRVPSAGPKREVLAHWKAEDFESPKTGGSIGVQEACFMLLGFALENLTKGILVCRDPRLVTKSELRRWHGDGHDLTRLFDRCEIPLTEEERALLERTTRLVVWQGRYPVPMSFYDIEPGKDMLLGQVSVGRWPEPDFNSLQALYEKVEAELRRTMAETSPLPPDYNFGG
jgi:hypothetical protein